MATRVAGLDIGRSSVKAVVITASGRTWQLVEVAEAPIVRAEVGEAVDPHQTPPMGQPIAPSEPDTAEPPTPAADASALVEVETALDGPTKAAIASLAAQGIFEVDQVIVGLPTDDFFTATLTLPFSGAKEIEAVLPPQLEGRLPVEADEYLLDHMASGTAPNGEHRVFAVAVDPARLAFLLGDLAAAGIDPRIIDVPPWTLFGAGRALLDRSDEAIAIVDIGSTSSELLVYAGDAVQYARSLNAGGQRVTEALASMFGIDTAKAEDGKLREGFIDPQMRDASGPTGNDETDVATACREGTKPLIRQLRRSLQAHASESGQPVAQVYLCGGGASLPGLAEYVGQSLGVPTRALPLAVDATAAVTGFGDVGHRFVQAIGLALRGSGRESVSTFNVRKGAFAFRGSYDYLTQRAPALAFGMVALLVAGFAFLLATNRMLATEQAAVNAALQTLTEDVFGEATSDPGAIRRRLSRGAQLPGFIPERTATSLFADIVNAAEDTQNLGYEATATRVEVDLERALVRVEGTADGAESVDEYQRVLASIDCLYELRRDELSQRPGSDGFTFSIVGAATCNPDEDD